MRVILFGYYGFGNTGDEAVLAGLLHGLREFGPPDAEYLVLSGNPKETEALHGVPAKPRNSIPTLLRTTAASDCWIFGGGSLLQNVTGPFTLPYYLGVMRLVALWGRPFVLHAQGIGPIVGRFHQRMTDRTVRRAARLSVRDRDSKETLVALGVPAQSVQVGADLAFLLPTQLAEVPADQPQLVGVAVREWGNTSSWLPHLVNGLRRFLSDTGAEALIVPMDRGDEGLAQRLVQALPGRAVATAGDAPYTDKLALLAGCSLVVAMRLHAGIFAALGHVPSVFISYDPKVTAMARRLDAPVLDVADLEAARLVRELTKTWEQRAGRRQGLVRTVGMLRKQAEEDMRGLVRTLLRPKAMDGELSLG